MSTLAPTAEQIKRRVTASLLRQLCACGHTAHIHGNTGAGGCEGILTGFDDGTPGVHDCGCWKFKAVAR